MYAVERPRDEWEMREDARILARANEIMADEKRHADAVAMAKKISAEDMARISAMKKVANSKVTVKATRSSQSADDIFRASISNARVAR